MTIYEDNMPVLHICKNQVTSQRTKHFALALHYVRECIERGVIRVEYISTHRQLADALTKALPKPQLLKLRQMLYGGSVVSC